MRRAQPHDGDRRPPPVHVAFDDTDSVEGGCTTRVVFDALAAAPELALQAMPRLVRLNPNVPHKTRGNGAVAFDLVLPRGPRVQVGAWRGRPIYAFPEGAPVGADPALLGPMWAAIKARSRPGASPGLVAVSEPPMEMLYWQAVRTELTLDEARSVIDGPIFGDGRGIIGAAAALAWAGPATSYELLAYRAAARTGTPRAVDEAGLRALDVTGATFHSADGELTACVPHTPCPVLAGLRGLDPERLVDEALPVLEASPERPEGWMLFASNQASGDHVSRVPLLRDAPHWGTIEIPLTVTGDPADQRGGHTRVPCSDAFGHPVDIIAFEPTKRFRDVVRALRPGDRITAVGAFDETLRLERLRVDALAEASVKTANPMCPRCGRSMKSKGRDAGYRCPDGHGSAPAEAATRVMEERTLRPGCYEVPVIARRHLHRPLLLETASAAPG